MGMVAAWYIAKFHIKLKLEGVVFSFLMGMVAAISAFVVGRSIAGSLVLGSA